MRDVATAWPSSRFVLLLVSGLAFGVLLWWLVPAEERVLDRSVVEGPWVAQEIDGLAVLAGDSSRDAWVMLSEDRMAGNDGCMMFSGKYAVSGGELSLSHLVEAVQSCGGGFADKERTFAGYAFREVIASGEIDVFTDGESMVWVAEGHEVVFAR